MTTVNAYLSAAYQDTLARLDKAEARAAKLEAALEKLASLRGDPPEHDDSAVVKVTWVRGVAQAALDPEV